MKRHNRLKIGEDYPGNDVLWCLTCGMIFQMCPEGLIKEVAFTPSLLERWDEDERPTIDRCI